MPDALLLQVRQANCAAGENVPQLALLEQLVLLVPRVDFLLEVVVGILEKG